jgi:hypothetical protein
MDRFQKWVGLIREPSRLAGSGVEHEHIQSIADDGAHLFREQRSTLRSSQVS